MPEATIVIIFFTSMAVGFSGAMAPGPLLTLDIAESARRGFWAGPILVLGHGLLELAMVAGLVGGLGHFLEKSLVAGIVGLGGGLFLLWMGYSIIRSNWSNPGSFSDGSSAMRVSGNPVLAGILVSLSNPYWLLWWATVGSSYVVWAMGVGVAGLIAFYSGHILSDLSWYSLVSLLVASGRKIVRDKVYRGLLFVCGLFLLGLGGYFVFSGIRFLR